MAHWLRIIKDGKVEMIELDPKNPKTIKLKGGSHYELLDEQLNPIEPLKIIEDQAGLTLYTEAGDAPSLILQNYTRYQPLVSGSTITLNSEPVLASQVFSASAAQGISSSLLWAGGGILAAGAVAGVALSGGGSKGSNTNAQPIQNDQDQAGAELESAQVNNTNPSAANTPSAVDKDVTPIESTPSATPIASGSAQTGGDNASGAGDNTQTGGDSGSSDAGDNTQTGGDNGSSDAGDNTQTGGDDESNKDDNTQTGGDSGSDAGDSTQIGGDDESNKDDNTQTGGDDESNKDDNTQTGGDDESNTGENTQTGGDDESNKDDNTQTNGDSGSDAGDNTQTAGDSGSDAGDNPQTGSDSGSSDAGDNTQTSGDSGSDAGDSTQTGSDSGSDAGDNTQTSGDSGSDAGDSTQIGGDDESNKDDNTQTGGDDESNKDDNTQTGGDSGSDAGDSTQIGGDDESNKDDNTQTGGDDESNKDDNTQTGGDDESNTGENTQTGGDSGSDAGDNTQTGGDSGSDAGDSTQTSGDDESNKGENTQTGGDSGSDAGDSTQTGGDSGSTTEGDTQTGGDSGSDAGDNTQTGGDSGSDAGDNTQTGGDSGSSDAGDNPQTGGDSGSSDAGDNTQTGGDSGSDAGDNPQTGGDSGSDAGDNTQTGGDDESNTGENTQTGGDNASDAGDNTQTGGDSGSDAGDNTQTGGDSGSDAGDNTQTGGDSGSSDAGDNPQTGGDSGSSDAGDNTQTGGDSGSDAGDNTQTGGDSGSDAGDNTQTGGDNASDAGDNTQTGGDSGSSDAGDNTQTGSDSGSSDAGDNTQTGSDSGSSDAGDNTQTSGDDESNKGDNTQTGGDSGSSDTGDSTQTGGDDESNKDDNTQTGGDSGSSDAGDNTQTGGDNGSSDAGDNTQTGGDSGSDAGDDNTQTGGDNAVPETEDKQPEPPKGKILHVEQNRYYDDFETALKAASAGDTLKLFENVEASRTGYKQGNDGRVEALDLKSINIDGQGHKLHIPARPLSLLGDVMFKDVKLELQPLANSLNDVALSLGSGGAVESQQYIFLNGNKLTLDQVDTKIEGQNDRTRPVIVMGAEKGKADAGHAELVVLNADKTNGQTQLKAIVAGSLDSAKESTSLIDLGAGTVVLDDVAFADKQPMNGKVTLVNRSSQVRKISGQGTNNEVILENVHYSFPEPSFNGVQNLTFNGNSGASLSNLRVADKLTLSAQSNLAVGSFNGGSLSVGNIQSDNATLTLGDHADFKLEGNIQGTLNVKTTQPKDSLEKGANSNAQTGQRADGYVISDQAVDDEVIEQETKVGVNFEFAEDNAFALSDSDTTVLRGTVSDFRDGDRLEIQIWGERYPADVGSDGQFSIAVPTNVLLQDTFDGTDVGQLEIFVWRGDNNVFDGDFNALEYRVISAENAGTTDNELQALAQNSEQNAPLVDEQTEEEMPQTLRIELDEITSDDYLNVSEARAATTTIRGQVSGEGAAAGQKVSLNIGGETREATLDQHLAFSEQVDTSLLVKNATYQVNASLAGQSASRTYKVAEQATNQIQITDIGEHNPASETVRISGTLRLDGVAAKYYNDLFIETVQVSLNGKTYTAGLGKAKSSQVRGTFGLESVKDKAFSFDIPVEELRAAQGQTMTFSLPKEYAVIYYDKMGTYNSDPRSIETQYARIDDQSKYSLNPNAWLQGGTGKTIVASEPSAKTYVNGTVDGNAQQGDEVVVQIGTQRYVGEVGGDKRFSVEVDKSALQQAGIDSLSATLSGKDYAQNTIEVSDVSRFQATVDRTSGEFVAKFNTSHHAEEDVPYFIKGIRYGNFYNTEGHLGRQPIGLDSYSLKYHFVNEGSGAIPFTQDEMAMIRDVLKEISSHTRLSFVEKAAIEPEDKPDILIHQISSYDGRSRGSAGAGVYFDYRGFSASKASYELAMHELLHSLGTRDIKDEDFGNENSTLTSVMSYNLRMAKATAPMRMQDLMYLHYRYGVNPEQHKGNDVYTFKAMTHYSLENSSYIWDGAGIDTFDASMEDKKVVVDLTPGSWIYRGAQTEKFWADETKYFYNNPKAFFGNSFYEYEGTIIPNVMDYNEDQAFIGYGTQIERLIGSRFDDELKGNEADNEIFGGDGNDQIWGNDGNDYIDGGKGADVMYGGNGNDIFVVDDEADEVHEALDQGTDTVLSYISYKLGENLENLELLGNAQNAEGNALANRIVGNSSANTLTGGAGADTFVFNSPLNGNVDTITDFKVGEDRIELAKAVFTQLTETNIMEYIHYDKASGELRYDPDGSGKQDPIVFAKLSDNLEIGAAQFVLG